MTTTPGSSYKQSRATRRKRRHRRRSRRSPWTGPTGFPDNQPNKTGDHGSWWRRGWRWRWRWWRGRRLLTCHQSKPNFLGSAAAALIIPPNSSSDTWLLVMKDVDHTKKYIQSFPSIACVLLPSITIVVQLFTREWFFGCGRTLVDLWMELQWLKKRINGNTYKGYSHS